jgi:hypothetical protein
MGTHNVEAVATVGASEFGLCMCLLGTLHAGQMSRGEAGPNKAKLPPQLRTRTRTAKTQDHVLLTAECMQHACNVKYLATMTTDQAANLTPAKYWERK